MPVTEAALSKRLLTLRHGSVGIEGNGIVLVKLHKLKTRPNGTLERWRCFPIGYQIDNLNFGVGRLTNSPHLWSP